jgi:hypothetical protein
MHQNAIADHHLPTLAASEPVNLTELAPHAAEHVRDMLTYSIQHSPAQRALVVFDTQSTLAHVLTVAYRACLPHAEFLNFDTHTSEVIMARFAALQAQDLVVLVQSTNFRLDAFRIRVELFKRGLKVIEHPHLGRMQGQEVAIYIDALAYEPAYYRDTGHALKRLIDQSSHGVLDTGGALLEFASPFESAKLNIGDYSAMPNVGGQFPIGEVFTEARDLQAVNGAVRIFVFGDTSFSVNQPAQPITMIVERGQVVAVRDSTPEFDAVLAKIKEDEGVVWVRELGFGLNRALSKQRTVADIGTFERMCGVHLSLGAKHGVYGKPNFKRGDGKYHVDVFAATETVQLDGQIIFRDGAWCVS